MRIVGLLVGCGLVTAGCLPTVTWVKNPKATPARIQLNTPAPEVAIAFLSSRVLLERAAVRLQELPAWKHESVEDIADELSRALRCEVVATAPDEIEVLVKLSDPRDSEAATNALVVAYRDLMLRQLRNTLRAEIAEIAELQNRHKALKKEIVAAADVI